MKSNKGILKVVSALGLSILMGMSMAESSHAEYSTTRIAGSHRYNTSLESAKYFESDTLVFASGKEFADALSSVNICNKFGAKLVLVRGTEDMSSFVSDGGYKKVYIIGGHSAISDEFQTRLGTTEAEVVRLAGSDRFSTNTKTILEAGYDHVGVANGRMYPDALSASRFIKEKEIGLALVESYDRSISSELTASVDYVFGGVNSVAINEGVRIEIGRAHV